MFLLTPVIRTREINVAARAQRRRRINGEGVDLRRRIIARLGAGQVRQCRHESRSHYGDKQSENSL